MRILMTAYACDQDQGSEPGAGFRFVKAACEAGHDIHLVTRLGLNEQTRRRLTDLGVRITECGPPIGRNHHISYILWLLRCRYKTRRLLAVGEFDLAHHVTYASDSLPPAIAPDKVRLVWGPIGGTQFPHQSIAVTRGLARREVVRWRIKGLLRQVFCASAARHSAVIIAQNYEVAAQFRRWSQKDLLVRPNVVVDAALAPHPKPREQFRAVFVGRLIPSKGADLAIKAIAATQEWSLTVVGGGPQEEELRQLAQRAGVDKRVDFLGQVPRSEVLAAVSAAHCMLFPSVREAAGWAVAEARSVGTPVVALDVAGPQFFASIDPGVRVVPPAGDVIASMVNELNRLDGFPQDQPAEHAFDEEALRAFLSEVYQRCV